MSNRDLEYYQKMMNGDKQSLEAIYDKYEKLLYSFVIKLSSDHSLAEEVLQEVFIKLWTQKAQYDETKGKFSSWIVTITRYTAIDLIRARKESVSLEEETDVPEEKGDSVEDLVEWKEKSTDVRRALSQLSDEQRRIVDLFYFKGCSQSKIAEECNLPLGTVKGRLRLALKHLKKHLSIQEGGISDA
ncbi:sigma-70 family RNA polymerase sigma factor [Halobacillus litoralis]|uniref:RNA polymerase sigma factor n=1 Tax=Halobacillus litoralis TaxID=45668 RepID=UPI001CD5E8F8|nr:sigma-70 family RNA polymerase sigma factor [Halobacillus litoralis]MCA0971485.1 sigma-70 family RNA polymerase sigma factor [Halobacillus litoralis]